MRRYFLHTLLHRNKAALVSLRVVVIGKNCMVRETCALAHFRPISTFNTHAVAFFAVLCCRANLFAAFFMRRIAPAVARCFAIPAFKQCSVVFDVTALFADVALALVFVVQNTSILVNLGNGVFLAANEPLSVAAAIVIVNEGTLPGPVARGSLRFVMPFHGAI